MYKYIRAAAVERDSEVYVRLAVTFKFLQSLIKCIQKYFILEHVLLYLIHSMQ